MSRKVSLFWVAGGAVLSIALIIAGCSGGGNDSPTAPPDPFVGQTTGNSDTFNTGSEIQQVQGPGVHLEKATNGFDADTAPGPSIAVGDTVTWTYDVTNIGDVTLVSWAVTDNMLGADPVCSGTDLEPLGTETCTVTGTAIDGQYANVGTVRASDGNERVEASDPSHYLGGGGRFSAIELQKTTQVARDEDPEDADYPTGPIVLTGNPVRWDYEITNIGQVALEDWLISDDQIGEICRGTTLAIGEVATCFTTGRAEAGQYANVGLVRAFDGTTRISDEDPSHYFGSDPHVALNKLTDGEDGPSLIEDCPVTWTYEVINDGNIDLEQIELSDNRIGPIGCPLTTLPAGGSMICEVTGTVEADDYENLGSVAALDPIGTEVFAEDPSHYLVTDECSNVVPSDDELWPPNHRLTTIDLMGSVCGGEATSFLITGVTQDEPVNGLGDGDTSPDAFIAADGSSVDLRRERAGGGNGRVYEIAYDAVNNDGAGCSGFVTVGVPHDQSGSPAFDDGQDYDSTQP